LTDLKTRSIIPVELNAILYWNTKIIAEFYKISGNLEKEAEYIQKSQDIYQVILERNRKVCV
jgi:alpha,alpha-trehalase